MLPSIEWISVAAIISGPVIAVLATRLLDRQVEKRERRLAVFRSLMETRGLRLDPSHVSALNLVEIEFYEDKKVRTAFRAYIQNLSGPLPPLDEQDRHFRQRNNLFLELLSEMGTAVGMRFDKNDLERLTYSPIAWDADQSLQRRNAHLLNQLLSGERAFPVASFAAQNSPYPPPPGG